MIDRAIGSDQGLKYVYALDSEKNVQYRRIKTGALESDGLRVISDGTETGRVGCRRRIAASPTRMPIQPEQTVMPSLAQVAAGETQPSEAPKATTTEEPKSMPATPEIPTTTPTTGSPGATPTKGKSAD